VIRGEGSPDRTGKKCMHRVHKKSDAAVILIKKGAAVMRLIGSVILMIFFVPCTAGAHPHIFIENTVRIVFDGTGMTGVRARWVFDEMFSSTMIEGYDADKDGAFAPAEVEELRKGAFANLKNYNYFTYITIGKKAFDVVYVKDFQAGVKDHRIIYSFFIPCHVKAGAAPRNVTVAMYDETYYTDMLLVDYQSDHTAAPGTVTSSIKQVENFNKTFYFGQIAPVELIVTFKK